MSRFLRIPLTNHKRTKAAITMTHDGTFIWYDTDGSPCTRERALELLGDVALREIGRTRLELVGRELWVYTAFVPVNHDPATWSTPTDHPALWVSEIIGGPDDLNGTTSYYYSRDEAVSGHEDMIDRAVASGCAVAS